MSDRSVETAIAQAEEQLCDLPSRLHANCIVCGTDNPSGLALVFALRYDSSVAADFELDETYSGYQGCPHGGVTSAVLDASMCHWLFAHGVAGVTAELSIRFRHPIRLGQPARAVAKLKRASHPLYVLEAHVVQNGQIKARATGKFMHKPELLEPARGDADD